MSNRLIVRRIACAVLSSAFAVAAFSASAAEVNVYSYRQPQLVQPLFDKFTEKTGIKVNSIFSSKGLIERQAAEGRNSPADVVLTADISRLTQAKTVGITQPVNSKVLNDNIPASFRDPQGHWFALGLRARVIYASKARVKQDNITYEELADPKWRGKLCTRSGQHEYSLGLIASMIAHKSAAEAEAWLAGVRQNLAAKPSGNDRSQAKAIAAGQCDISLGNTYYMALMQTNAKDPEQKQWAAAVKILFPNAQDRGTHVNVSGAAMAKYAPHPKEALALMEFLISEEAQKIYAEIIHEYPVRPGVPPSERVRSWGELKADQIPLADIAKNAAKASELVDKTGFNDGPSS